MTDSNTEPRRAAGAFYRFGEGASADAEEGSLVTVSEGAIIDIAVTGQQLRVQEDGSLAEVRARLDGLDEREAVPAMVTAHYDPDHGTVTLTFASGIWADEVRTRRPRSVLDADEVRVGLVGDQEWIKAREGEEYKVISVTEGAAPSERDELLAELRAEIHE